MTEQSTLSFRWVADVLFRDWKLKLVALAAAAVFFVITRDEVVRTFTIPVRVEDDPERVLLTELPETVQVELRGPWTRVSRLQDQHLQPALLDLANTKEGPLQIDPASVVMPPGVILDRVIYDHVDLRFEPVVEREVRIVPTVSGQPAADYQLVGMRTDPPKWTVRGARANVQRIEDLRTESVEVDGARETMHQDSLLLPLPDRVRYTAVADGELPRVRVEVLVTPVEGQRSFDVPVAVSERLDPRAVVPRTFKLELSGPEPDLKALEKAVKSTPLRGQAFLEAGESGGADVVEVRFSWSPAVAEPLRARLKFEPAMQRFPTEEPEDEPKDEPKGR